MEQLTVEQKIVGSTYKPAQTSAAQHATDLMGFAYSFEELLQRVGARLDHAFSAADQSSGLLTNSAEPGPKEPVDDASSAPRDDARDDHTGDDGGDQKETRSANDEDRDTRTDTSDNTTVTANGPETSKTVDATGDQNSTAARDGQDARTGEDTGDGEKSASEDGVSEGGNDNQKTAKSNDGQADDGVAGPATAHSAGVGQAAAVYATGMVNMQSNANQNANAHAQGPQTVGNADTDPALLGQLAAQAAAQGKGAERSANHNLTAQQQAAQKAQQKADPSQQGGKVDALQNQARQLSQAIGGENRATVNVTVENEASTLTSKPTLTVGNASILTQDSGSATAAKGNQQQGQNAQQQVPGQTAQQIQAAMNQSQAAQQATVPTGQGGSGGPSGPSAGGISGAQGAGSAAQAQGGPDILNTGAQNANAAQSSQQTQQTREAQPQQQAQQAHRGAAQSGSITDQISVKISKALQNGTDRISIQLKPAELGRVDVKMEMTHDGRVMTVVTAEKQDTLDLLRRDSSELRQALADAGLQTGDMEFNLKGQEQQTADAEGDGASSNADGDAEAADAADDQSEDGIMSAWESGIFMDGRIDMRA